jgi:hypothetical protein
MRKKSAALDPFRWDRCWTGQKRPETEGLAIWRKASQGTKNPNILGPFFGQRLRVRYSVACLEPDQTNNRPMKGNAGPGFVRHIRSATNHIPQVPITGKYQYPASTDIPQVPITRSSTDCLTKYPSLGQTIAVSGSCSGQFWALAGGKLLVYLAFPFGPIAIGLATFELHFGPLF